MQNTWEINANVLLRPIQVGKYPLFFFFQWILCMYMTAYKIEYWQHNEKPFYHVLQEKHLIRILKYSIRQHELHLQVIFSRFLSFSLKDMAEVATVSHSILDVNQRWQR